jgi:hypothetical protein
MKCGVVWFHIVGFIMLFVTRNVGWSLQIFLFTPKIFETPKTEIYQRSAHETSSYCSAIKIMWPRYVCMILLRVSPFKLGVNCS